MTFVFNWGEQMMEDVPLALALRHGLRSNPNVKILIVNERGTISSRAWASQMNRFIGWVHGNRWYAVPVVGIIPQHLNTLQATRYVFDNEAGGSIGVIQLVRSRIPLLTPFLDLLKQMIKENTLGKGIEEIVSDVAEAFGIMTSRTPAALLATAGVGISNLSAYDIQALSDDAQIVNYDSGYEVFTINPPITAVPSENIEGIDVFVLGGSVLTNPSILYNALLSHPSLFLK
jgi:hypothetical protein